MTVSDLNEQVRQYDMREIPEKGNKNDINGGVKGKNKEQVRNKRDWISNGGAQKSSKGQGGEASRPIIPLGQPRHSYRPVRDNQVSKEKSSLRTSQGPCGEGSHTIGPALDSHAKTKNPDNSTCEHLFQKTPSPPPN